MPVLNHVCRFKVAEVDPNGTLFNTSNLTDVSHDAEHQLLSLLLGSSGSDIPAYPEMPSGRFPAQESVISLFLFENDLDKELRCARCVTVTTAD